MPANAIRYAKPDFVLKGSEIASTLNRLVREPSPEPPPGATSMSERTTPTTSVGVPSESHDIADRGDNALTSGSITGPPTALTCPDCGGALWERTEEGGLTIYRCHVGHAYTAESMAAGHEELLEQTLWEALRMFEERAEMHRRMSDRARQTQPEMSVRFGERADESEQRGGLIRRILLGENGGGGGNGGNAPGSGAA